MNASRSEILRRVAYLAGSVTLIASQNLVAWIARQAYADERPLDLEFWLTPLSSTLELWGLPPIWGAVIFAYCLLIAWLLALLSFKLAQRTNRGFVLAVLSVVPVVQLAAIATNAILPSKDALDEEGRATRHASKSVALGLLEGVALIVFAVLISAVTFGAYGWGLFVMTPFLVGITTGYLVNSETDLGSSRTMKLAIASAGLGSLALVVLALEGIICILLAAPLAVPIVMLGAALGRGVAIARHNRRNPIASVAVLPMIFMLEAAIPPEAPIATQFEIEIGAAPDIVWQALTSPESIGVAPGLPALAGLAYPMSGKLEGEGVGAKRIGAFSTGTATEVVTEWKRDRVLAFRVEHQPPAMEEMSPYRRVHAPHVQGYFLTGETRFDLMPIGSNRTLLRVSSEHKLRIDPVPYWEPIARLAIRQNVGRVLEDIKEKSERNSVGATLSMSTKR
jgi:uncharacterized membrane protein (DUF485 family)